MKRSVLLATLFAASLSAFDLPAQDLFDQARYRDFYFTFKQTNWWNDLLATRSTGVDIKADLVVDGKTYTDVGIRIKGASSSSVSTNKRPFSLTMDAFVPTQTLYGFETLNLNNGAYDPTMTREPISYAIFRNYMPAPRTTYIRLHFNNSFWGAYSLIEQPNKDLLRTWFLDVDGTRYKGDRPSGAAVNTSTLSVLGSTPAAYQPYYEIKTPSHPNAWLDLIDLIDKLNNLPNSTFEKEIVKVLNVDRALWYLACNNAVINSDDYMGAGHNYYMYFDPMNGQMNMLPWDLNEAFGVHGPASNPWRYSITTGSTSSFRPLTRRLLAVPRWRELYFAHYRTILKRWIDWTNVLEPLNRRLQDVIRADIAVEPYYLFNRTYFAPSFSGSIFFGGHSIQGLKEVAVQREAYLRTLPDLTKPEPQLSEIRYSSAKVSSGSAVSVTVKVTGTPAIQTVVVRSTTLGVYTDDPMYDDGMHGDGQAGDGVYGGSFTAGSPGLPTRFYIHATDAAGTVQVLPEAAEHEFFSVPVGFPSPAGDLVINEVLADNETGDQDANQQYEDWVELHNRGATPYDASGCYLSDNLLQPKKWQLPANSLIPAGGFLRIWCDDEPAQGPLHASFRLSKDGEVVVLTDTDANNNKRLDGIQFGQQKADRSFGRVPDGAPDLFYIWTPSGADPVTGSGTGRAVRFDPRRTAAPSGADLVLVGVPRVNQAVSLNVVGGPPNAAAAIGLSVGLAPVDVAGLGPMVIDTAAMLVVGLKLDAGGTGGFSDTLPAAAAGWTVYAQGLTTELLNAVVIRVSL